MDMLLLHSITNATVSAHSSRNTQSKNKRPSSSSSSSSNQYTRRDSNFNYYSPLPHTLPSSSSSISKPKKRWTTRRRRRTKWLHFPFRILFQNSTKSALKIKFDWCVGSSCITIISHQIIRSIALMDGTVESQ